MQLTESHTMSNNNDSKKIQTELELLANRMSRMAKSLDYLFEAAQDQGDHIAGLLLSLSNEAFQAHDELNALAEKLANDDEDQSLPAMMGKRDRLKRELADILIDIAATESEPA